MFPLFPGESVCLECFYGVGDAECPLSFWILGIWGWGRKRGPRCPPRKYLGAEYRQLHLCCHDPVIGEVSVSLQLTWKLVTGFHWTVTAESLPILPRPRVLRSWILEGDRIMGDAVCIPEESLTDLLLGGGAW